ncbi:MAG: S8 family serine peptidase [Deinococcales bacterium]
MSLSLMLISLLMACNSPNNNITPRALSFDRARAAVNEQVTANLKSLSSDARVFVAGVEATVSNITPSSLDFIVPDVPGGPQEVRIQGSFGTASDILGILREVVPNRVLVLFDPSMTQTRVESLLRSKGYQFISYIPLSSRNHPTTRNNPCTGILVEVGLDGQDIGEALEDLEDETGVLDIDPVSDHDPDNTPVDHLTAVGATISRQAGVQGRRTAIAVIDTGVSPALELGTRLRADLGYNFVDNNNQSIDVDSLNVKGGHGTAIAVLAAGEVHGIAPAASIIPLAPVMPMDTVWEATSLCRCVMPSASPLLVQIAWS